MGPGLKETDPGLQPSHRPRRAELHRQNSPSQAVATEQAKTSDCLPSRLNGTSVLRDLHVPATGAKRRGGLRGSFPLGRLTGRSGQRQNVAQLDGPVLVWPTARLSAALWGGGVLLLQGQLC